MDSDFPDGRGFVPRPGVDEGGYYMSTDSFQTGFAEPTKPKVSDASTNTNTDASNGTLKGYSPFMRELSKLYKQESDLRECIAAFKLKCKESEEKSEEARKVVANFDALNRVRNNMGSSVASIALNVVTLNVPAMLQTCGEYFKALYNVTSGKLKEKTLDAEHKKLYKEEQKLVKKIQEKHIKQSCPNMDDKLVKSIYGYLQDISQSEENLYSLQQAVSLDAQLVKDSRDPYHAALWVQYTDDEFAASCREDGLGIDDPKGAFNALKNQMDAVELEEKNKNNPVLAAITGGSRDPAAVARENDKAMAEFLITRAMGFLEDYAGDCSIKTLMDLGKVLGSNATFAIANEFDKTAREAFVRVSTQRSASQDTAVDSSAQQPQQPRVTSTRELLRATSSTGSAASQANVAPNKGGGTGSISSGDSSSGYYSKSPTSATSWKWVDTVKPRTSSSKSAGRSY